MAHDGNEAEALMRRFPALVVTHALRSVQESPHTLSVIGRFSEVATRRGENSSSYDHLNDHQICIGQALALRCGESVRFKVGVPGYDSRTDNSVNTLADLLQIVQGGDIYIPNDSLNSVAVRYHEQHSTRVFVAKVDGITYLWYFNPWGSFADCYKSVVLHHKHLRHTHGDPMRSRTLEIIKNSPHDIFDRTAALRLWEAKYTAGSSNPGEYTVHQEEMLSLPGSHVMSLLEWLRFRSVNDRVCIIHPSLTMPLVGPQTQYSLAGCSDHPFVAAATKIDSERADGWTLGACSAWEELYSAHLQAEFRIPNPNPVEIVSNLRKRNMLTRENSAKETMGKFMFVSMPRDAGFGCGYNLDVLQNLVPLLPSSENIRDVPAYNKNVVTRYKEIVSGMDEAPQVVRKRVTTFLNALARALTSPVHMKNIQSVNFNFYANAVCAQDDQTFISLLKLLLVSAACKQHSCAG
ncbi:unnamed protein product [Ectocarpus sp. 6 AP-2014]